MNIKTILDLLNYVETEEKAYELIYYISSLEEQLQQKENIIKEVREYIEDLYDVRFTDKDKRKILEILDKTN